MLLNPLYRFRMIHFISSIRSAEVFNLNVSRPNILSDPICSYLDSERKVAFVGDGVNSSYLARFLYDDIFQKLIVATNVSHELQKLSVFFQFTPEYELKLPKSDLIAPSAGYFVVALGAGVVGRNWPDSRFLELTKRIISHTSLDVVVTGTANFFGIAKEIEGVVGSRCLNLVGQTSSFEFSQIIANGVFVISNESSAAQIAFMTNVSAFVIVGGGHFGRFVPFPASLTGMKKNGVIPVFQKMDCFGCNWSCHYVSLKKRRPPCITEVSVDNVYEEISQFLKI